MREKLYLNTAKFYDGGNFRNFSEDINLYKEFLFDGIEILDIGCGTGRVALDLINEVKSLVGIDLSKTMLEIFREKVKELPSKEQVKIEIIEADMLNYNLNKKFDLIIFPFCVFQAIRTDKERYQCLKVAKEHLKENGKMIINAFDPNPKILANFESIYKFDYEYEDKELQAKVTRHTKGLKHNKLLKEIESMYIFNVDYFNGEKEVVEEKLYLGYQEKLEMDKMFETANLKIENLYSWWDKSLYNPNEHKFLIYILNL